MAMPIPGAPAYTPVVLPVTSMFDKPAEHDFVKRKSFMQRDPDSWGNRLTYSTGVSFATGVLFLASRQSGVHRSLINLTCSVTHK